MKDIWKTMKLGMYIFALPLVATAAASAHQWMSDTNPALVPDFEVTATVNDGAGVQKLRSHTITLTSEGVVSGRLVSINAKTREAVGLGELKVYFAQNGEVVQQADTESDGSFSVEQLAEGAYSFIAAGESGFAAYGVNVVSGDADANPTVMEVAAVSPKFTAVREILENRLPSKVAKEIIELANSNLDGASPVELEGANRVRIIDGQLSGNLVSIWGLNEKVAGTYVHIVKNDEQVAVTQADENGHFQFPGIEPGVYDFVAAGPSGFAAVGFEAVPEDVEFAQDTDIIDVSMDGQDYIAADIPMDAGYADSMNVSLTSPQDNYIVDDSFVSYGSDYMAPPIEYAGEAAGCGCAAGGACGGCGDTSGYSACGGGAGGCGGGGGAIWKLAAIAGIVIGAIALGDDDDDIQDMSPPVN